MKPFSGFANFLKRTNSTPVYRMGPNYVVQPSPGKGEGVFARRNLAPGTVILSDQATCKIFKPGIHITENDVLEAYQKLNAADQERFMGLHESHRLLSSKLLRIYKANCFRTNDDGTVLFLEISKFNHSCVPNASKEVEGDVANIVAKNPLPDQRKMAYWYLKARLLEAEGLVGVDVFTGYWQAYMALAKQIDACDVKLRPSLDFLQDLKHQARRVIADTCGERSRAFRTFKETLDRLRGNESDFALGAVSHGMSYFDRV